MTNNDDEQRYAEYFKQQESATPLDEVRTLRAEQLAACDLKKHQEMAQMRKNLDNKNIVENDAKSNTKDDPEKHR